VSTEPLQVLGLPEGSTKNEIKARWRELVMTLHPDRGGNIVQFQETHEAYKRAVAQAPEHHGCPTCHGEGTIKQVHGFNQISTVCPTCMGEGHL
jgi:DnaJ-class molecular chaperone